MCRQAWAQAWEPRGRQSPGTSPRRAACHRCGDADLRGRTQLVNFIVLISRAEPHPGPPTARAHFTSAFMCKVQLLFVFGFNPKSPNKKKVQKLLLSLRLIVGTVPMAGCSSSTDEDPEYISAFQLISGKYSSTLYQFSIAIVIQNNNSHRISVAYKISTANTASHWGSADLGRDSSGGSAPCVCVCHPPAGPSGLARPPSYREGRGTRDRPCCSVDVSLLLHRVC